MSAALIVAIALGAPTALLVVFKMIRWLDAQAGAFKTLQRDVPCMRTALDSLAASIADIQTFRETWETRSQEVLERVRRIEQNGKKGEGGSL